MLQRSVRFGLTITPLLMLLACGLPQPTGPSAPTNVRATAAPEAILVTWDHDGEGVTGFIVEREVDASVATLGGFDAVRTVAVISEPGAGARHFEDVGVEQDVSYSYSVAAVGAGGSSVPVKQTGPAVQPGPPVAQMCDDPTDEPIEDAVLAGVIREALALSSGPTCADLVALEHVDASWPQGETVTSLAGLEHAPNLQWIHLDGHDVVSLAPLEGSTQLQGLFVGGGQITDAAPIAGLTALLGLSLWGNQIDSFEPLRNLTELRGLYAGGMGISDVEPLTGLVKLDALHIGGSGLTDLDFLEHFPELVELDVSSNELTNAVIPVLTAFPDLQGLGIGATDITDLSFVTGYADLVRLRIWGLEIGDFTPVTELTALEVLNMDFVGVNDLSFLSAFTNLHEFTACCNEITDLAAIQGIDLQQVRLHYNAVTDISPLVANVHLGEGDSIDITHNCLDLTPGSAAMLDIQTLIDRGVDVQYEPQKEGC